MKSINFNVEEKSLEAKIQILVEHAWEQDTSWSEIKAWLDNFKGAVLSQSEERLYALFTLTRFMYFGKKLVREMLRSLYRDYFYSPLRQRIRRNFNNTLDLQIIDKAYEQELKSTKFVGVGNPAESGAHLLYYFRQINYLPKDLFADFASLLTYSKNRENDELSFYINDPDVKRLVFFDDIVGSGSQVNSYLKSYLINLKKNNPSLDIRFMSLFATTSGLKYLNQPEIFNGKAICLFELDESFKAFHENTRYFTGAPDWFVQSDLLEIMQFYGKKLWGIHPLGYKDGQLLIGFSHNTPDNVPPIFWCNKKDCAWHPVFIRFHKQYG